MRHARARRVEFSKSLARDYPGGLPSSRNPNAAKMRTKSVDSRLVEMLAKAVDALKHLDEAVSHADKLPEREAQQARSYLREPRNLLRDGIEGLRGWVETPPES